MFDRAIERFGHLLEEGQVYYFAGGRVRFDNYARKSDQFRSSSYSITFSETADIQPAIDDCSIKKVELAEISLDQASANLNKIVTITCIVNDKLSKPY
jgi:hypothetical protein